MAPKLQVDNYKYQIGVINIQSGTKKINNEQISKRLNCRVRSKKTGRWLPWYDRGIFNNMVGTGKLLAGRI